MRSARAVVLTTLYACTLFTSAARAQVPGEKLVRPSLLADAESIAPGGTFTLGVRLKMKEHWHTYWVNPGESGQATSVKFTGPAGFTFGDIQWPLPSKINVPGGFSYGYEEEALLLVPVTVGKDAAQGSAGIEAAVAWLACNDDTCVEGKAKVKVTVEVAGQAKPANAELFDAWRKRLPMPAGAAAEAVAKIEQTKTAAGEREPAFSVEWAQAPKKVEWFPISTVAAAIEDVAVQHDGRKSTITFKPRLFKPDDGRGGQIDGVLVYEDDAGVRRGIPAPVKVTGKPPTGK